MTNEPQSLADFQAFRQRMNDAIMANGTLTTKRFFTLDGKAYEKGAIPTKYKELLGLVASMVLRCDDCITYHIITAILEGCTDQELWETFDIALIVGGSIVIPHMRRAVARLEECRKLDPSQLQVQAATSKDDH